MSFFPSKFRKFLQYLGVSSAADVDLIQAEGSRIEVIETEPRLEPKKSSLKKKGGGAGAAAGADGSGGSSEAGAGEGKAISSGGGEFAFFNSERNNLRDYFQTISFLKR